MRQIEIRASRNYTVSIGSGALQAAGKTVRDLTDAKKVCIVSDSHVWPLYGDTVKKRLIQAGLECCCIQFEPGENCKTSDSFLQLLNFLCENRITRTDCLVALGGGTVGDLTGFAAATYLRGIAYLQIPTTLLAMVDASVGGKTAINLPSGKNLCGAFYQPAAVLCDTDTLATLPEDIFRDGCAEVIKYSILFDGALFAMLERDGLLFDREAVIARCVEWKRDVVAVDEFDQGTRMKLNFGHTIGHAIEKCSDYQISHGKAVAMGMAIVSRASRCADADRIVDLLKVFGLPVSTRFSAEALARNALSDKKHLGGTIKLITAQAIGNAQVCNMPIETLKTFIEAGL